MKRANVVIGAGFGDEGKGLITDFLCDRKYGTVVRFNGGAQAGHTVVDPNVGRHVFHHFGSGTLRGYKTHLSRHFITNPMLAMEEMKVLAKIGRARALTADPNGMVTTIYDMMLNQMVEEARGGSRHGSCGLGINETMKRHEGSDIHTQVFELTDGPKMTLKMARIRAEWLPARLDALGIKMTPEWVDRVKNDSHILRAVAICESYAAAHLVQMNDERVFDPAFFPDDAGIVFEGAQGLLLDEDHYFFPHVTHSHTGIWNVLDVAREAGIDHLNVTYVTRAYATRHGAGPFPDEVSTMRFEDPTNVPNEWQGTLRFGLLNLDLLFESINNDLFRARDEHTIRVIPDIALTCMDQVGDTVRVVVNKQEMTVTPDHLISLVEEYTGLPVRYVSRGPTRNTIEVRRLHAAAA